MAIPERDNPALESAGLDVGSRCLRLRNQRWKGGGSPNPFFVSPYARGIEMEKVQIGSATLYLGDCLDILPTLQKVDAVITDPPYGINENSAKVASRGKLAVPKDYGQFDWDKSPPSPTLMQSVLDAGEWKAIFGGNYFPMAATSCWLVWDKLNGSNDFADCELAWTNWPKAVRRLQWRWNGMIREGNEERFHPTQKPLQVMCWVIDLCPKADSIIDPFMGSGTTGVAALSRGKSFIGIERDPRYFKIACERMSAALAQDTLFEHRFPAAAAEQMEIGQ